MAFCTKCGAAQNEGMVFCANCGTRLEQPASADQQPNNQPYQQPPVPPFQPPFYPPQVVYVKPKVPGRGFGITAMVLGIVGLVYAVLMCFSAIHLANIANNLVIEYVARYVMGVLIYSSLAILGIVFGIQAQKRGYINGVSKSGVITGIIAAIFYFIAAIIFITI